MRAIVAKFGPAGNPKRPSEFRDGAIASSGDLIKDAEALARFVAVDRGILAVEMESAGVYRAAAEFRDVLFLPIRGISDIVGLVRDEAWTPYACRVAASFARSFVGVFAGLDGRRARNSRRQLRAAGGSSADDGAGAGQSVKAVTNLPETKWELPRVKSVAEIATLLRSGAGNTVVVTGPGGAGKTALAQLTASAVADRYRFIVYADLQHADADRLDRIVDTVGKVCGIVNAGTNLAAAIELGKKLSDGGLLLIVDNTDSPITEKELAHLALRLGSPRLLVTSRCPIDVGVHYPANGLTVCETAQLLRALGAAAVGVDVESVAKVLVDATDGLPLAIAALGQRVIEGASLAELVQRLKAPNGTRPKNRTSPALSGGEWSEQLLRQLSADALTRFGEPARAVALAGVLWGGYVAVKLLRALTQLGEAECDAATTQLVKAGLLREESREGQPVLIMHRLSQVAVSEAIPERAQVDGVVGRCVRAASDLVVRLSHDALGGDGSALKELLQKRECIRGVVSHLEDIGDDLRIVVLARETRNVFFRASLSTDDDSEKERVAFATEICIAGAAAATRLGDVVGCAKLTIEAGNGYIRCGSFARAAKEFEDALQWRASIAEPRLVVMALRRLGHCRARVGGAQSPECLYDEALRLAQKSHDAVAECRVLRSIGDLAYDAGEYGSASERYEESLKAGEYAGDTTGVARTTRRLANLCIIDKDVKGALRCLRTAATAYRQRHDWAGLRFTSLIGAVLAGGTDVREARGLLSVGLYLSMPPVVAEAVRAVKTAELASIEALHKRYLCPPVPFVPDAHEVRSAVRGFGRCLADVPPAYPIEDWVSDVLRRGIDELLGLAGIAVDCDAM